jgi:hypothetical protein
MIRIVAIAGLLTASLAAASAADKPVVLYEHAPWGVIRVGNPDAPMCIAGVGNQAQALTLYGMKKGSAIDVTKPEWNFTEHRGSMVLRVDDSGLGAGNAWYTGHAARIVGAKEVIYMIMSGMDVPGDGKLDVLGEDNKVIATFDITGVGAALKAWKECVDALQ